MTILTLFTLSEVCFRYHHHLVTRQIDETYDERDCSWYNFDTVMCIVSFNFHYYAVFHWIVSLYCTAVSNDRSLIIFTLLNGIWKSQTSKNRCFNTFRLRVLWSLVFVIKVSPGIWIWSFLSRGIFLFFYFSNSLILIFIRILNDEPPPLPPHFQYPAGRSKITASRVGIDCTSIILKKIRTECHPPNHPILLSSPVVRDINELLPSA